MDKQPENNKTASFGDKFIAFANKVSDVSGLVAAYLLVPLVIVFLIECISRNLFNSPTTWAYGMCFIIGGCAAVLGFGYAMKSGAMVRIDAFSSKLPEKAHCILDLVLYAVLFLPLTIGGTIALMLLTNWRRKQATVHMKLLKHGIMVIWLTQSSEKITQIM